MMDGGNPQLTSPDMDFSTIEDLHKKLKVMQNLLSTCGFNGNQRREILDATVLLLLNQMNSSYPYEVAEKNRKVLELLKSFQERDWDMHEDAFLDNVPPVSRNSRRGFYTPSDHKLEVERQLHLTQGLLRNARRRIKELEEENRRLLRVVSDLKGQEEASFDWGAAVSDESHDDLEWWKVIRLHFKATWKNLKSFLEQGSYNGCRYPRQLRDFYVLFSLSGDFRYPLMHKLLAFPSLTLVKSLRKECKAANQINRQTFDGTEDSIRRLVEHQHWSEDRRVVVSIDATAVKANFGLKASGDIIGCVCPMKLDQKTAHEILNDPALFCSFQDTNAGKIAKAVFVVLCNPLDPEIGAFPIAVFPHTQGQMDDTMLGRLYQINSYVAKMGLEVIGNGFDADSKFLPCARQFCDMIIGCLTPDHWHEDLRSLFQRNLTGIAVCPFFDPNHQAKCDRYRRVVPDSVQIFFEKNAPIFSKEDLKLLDIPDYVLDESMIRKMDDELPRQLFNVKNLLLCLEKKRIDLFIALYPTTALLVSIMNEKLDRGDRINMLCHAFCIVYLYYEAMLSYRPSPDCAIVMKRNKKDLISLWHKEFTQRYLSTLFMIIRTLLDPRPVNLGALGSHHCENFFGLVKRMSHSNESIERFMTSCEKAVLLAYMRQTYRLAEFQQSGRASMSGAHLVYEEFNGSETIGRYLCHALYLWNLATNYGSTRDTQHIQEDLESYAKFIALNKWTRIDECLKLIPVGLISDAKIAKTKSRTARMSGQVSTSGLKCNPRWISGLQVGNKNGRKPK